MLRIFFILIIYPAYVGLFWIANDHKRYLKIFSDSIWSNMSKIQIPTKCFSQLIQLEDTCQLGDPELSKIV